MKIKTHSKFVKWPISPKVKETHFEIINYIYPMGQFLERSFKLVLDPCTFCNQEVETISHCFLNVTIHRFFWNDIVD